jgi:UDP-N-acetylmuramate dehydrogenase
LEFAAGVPGSVGGGVFMNAGAHGGQMAEHVRKVGFLPLRQGEERLFAASGELEVLGHEDCAFAYRESVFQHRPGVVLWAELALTSGDAEESRRRLREFQAERRARQPLAWPNCGSVFRNPPGDHAGRLVDAVGGKGRRIGRAQISERHGNFIVNLGGATASDVLNLIDWAREAVLRTFGIELELEIRVVPA